MEMAAVAEANEQFRRSLGDNLVFDFEVRLEDEAVSRRELDVLQLYLMAAHIDGEGGLDKRMWVVGAGRQRSPLNALEPFGNHIAVADFVVAFEDSITWIFADLEGTHTDLVG